MTFQLTVDFPSFRKAPEAFDVFWKLVETFESTDSVILYFFLSTESSRPLSRPETTAIIGLAASTTECVSEPRSL